MFFAVSLCSRSITICIAIFATIETSIIRSYFHTFKTSTLFSLIFVLFTNQLTP